MNKELIMKADVLDILFENRNKTYGAYDLRKFYAYRLNKSLGIIMIIAAVFSVPALFAKKKTVLPVTIYTIPDHEMKQVADKSKEQVKKQEMAKAQPQAVASTQKMFLKNIVIVDNNTHTAPIETITETDAIGDTTLITVNAGPAIVQPVITGNTGPAETTSPVIDKTQPLDQSAVDVLPSYPGGMEALRKFLQRNLNNPEEMEEGESVSVKVTFVVGYEGKLKGFKITEDGGEVFNKEVIRVLKKMPDWLPGKANGENVSVYYTIPVKFTGAD